MIVSTFRLTEHHTSGPMSRNLPWLAELQPEMFVEIDPELAAERGIEDGGWMTIETERGEIEARANVTRRAAAAADRRRASSTRSPCRGTGARYTTSSSRASPATAPTT